MTTTIPSQCSTSTDAQVQQLCSCLIATRDASNALQTYNQQLATYNEQEQSYQAYLTAHQAWQTAQNAARSSYASASVGDSSCGTWLGSGCTFTSCPSTATSTGSHGCGFLNLGCSYSCRNSDAHVNDLVAQWVQSNPEPTPVADPGSAPSAPSFNVQCCSQIINLANLGSISADKINITSLQQCSQSIGDQVASADAAAKAAATKPTNNTSSSCQADSDCANTKLNKYIKTCSAGSCVYNKKTLGITGGIFFAIIIIIMVASVLDED
jgi:hypothetical protein